MTRLLRNLHDDAFRCLVFRTGRAQPADLAEAHLNASESPFRLGGRHLGRPRREPTKPGAAQHRGRDLDGPAVGGDDLLDDRQTQPAAAGVTGAGLVEPHEPCRTRAAAGPPGSRGRRPRRPARRRLGYLPDGRRPSTSSACRAALSTRFRTTCARRPGRRVPGRRPTPEVSTREPGPADATGLGKRQVVEVDVVVCPRDRPLVGPGEQQQLLDEPLHARRLLQHGIGELALGQSAPGCARATSAAWRMLAKW